MAAFKEPSDNLAGRQQPLTGAGRFGAMVLEVAVASGSDAIVTFNKQDFRGAEQFGLRLLTPLELLREIGVLK